MTEVKAGHSSFSGKSTGGLGSPQEVLTKLPQIQIPTFDGNLLNWVPFHNLFCFLVHSRKDMYAAEKHYYLWSCLIDDPLILIMI